jgi:hypothetical protein
MENSRKAAKALGEKTYLGKPCKEGHHAGRLTSNGECLICHQVRVSKDYHASRVFYAPDPVEETYALVYQFDFTPPKTKRIRRKPGWSSIDRG